MKLLPILLFFLLIPLAHALDCHPSECNDLLCKISGLGKSVECALYEGVKDFFLSPLSKFLAWAGVLVTTTPSLGNAGRELFDSLVFFIELLFLPVLLYNAVKLVYASAFSAEERVQAKEEVKKTIVNMLLIWLIYDLYAMSIDAANIISIALAPTSSEWLSAMPGDVTTGLLLLILVVAALVVFLCFAILRGILSYIGLFMLLLALLLEAFPITAAVGKGLKNIVAANFVVQIVHAFFLRVALAGTTDLFSSGDASNGLKLIFVAGTLLLAVAAGIVIYSAAVSSAVAASSRGRMALSVYYRNNYENNFYKGNFYGKGK